MLIIAVVAMLAVIAIEAYVIASRGSQIEDIQNQVSSLETENQRLEATCASNRKAIEEWADLARAAWNDYEQTGRVSDDTILLLLSKGQMVIQLGQ